jgi:hypothetical protein
VHLKRKGQGGRSQSLISAFNFLYFAINPLSFSSLYLIFIYQLFLCFFSFIKYIWIGTPTPKKMNTIIVKFISTDPPKLSIKYVMIPPIKRINTTSQFDTLSFCPHSLQAPICKGFIWHLLILRIACLPQYGHLRPIILFIGFNLSLCSLSNRVVRNFKFLRPPALFVQCSNLFKGFCQFC